MVRQQIVPSFASCFIGWDVGGWNCDKNGKSRDAIVILNSSLSIVGKPWRGNLRAHINKANTTSEWIQMLFTLCGSTIGKEAHCVMGIDTALGFSDEFVRLVTDRVGAGEIETSATNPYLFRRTEHFLFEQGLTPLSAIKDMIGSQATKGMHTLAKFAPHIQSCGIWSDGHQLTAIEAYPSACKKSSIIKKLGEGFQPLDHEDKQDALTCALVAYLFAEKRKQLIDPDSSVSVNEGWIWVPKDGI